MASGTDSLFISFILGLTAAGRLQDPANPPQETRDPPTTRESRGRIIVTINPSTQTMSIFETNSVGSGLGLGSLLRDLFSRKGGQRPASSASIDSLPRVEIAKGVDDDGQCVVCLEEWGDGETAKEMPCRHRFHGGCIEKWLTINGCCPVCRYEMPVGDEYDDSENKSPGETEGDGMRGDIWVSLSVGGMRNSENGDPPSDHEESDD
ncbi:hypothetical protein OROGR_002081 [Orobanche gracilis]